MTSFERLREAKQNIRQWIKQFSDEKLAQVYAFNQDGKMHYTHSCTCLVGVTLAEHLHVQYCCRSGGRIGTTYLDRTHYNRASYLPGATKAEFGYHYLGMPRDLAGGADELRRRRLSAILRAEMRLRARASLEASNPGHGSSVPEACSVA